MQLYLFVIVIMVKGIPWDDLHIKEDETITKVINKDPDSNTPNIENERNIEKDLISIARRTAFGLVVYFFIFIHSYYNIIIIIIN